MLTKAVKDGNPAPLVIEWEKEKPKTFKNSRQFFKFSKHFL